MVLFSNLRILISCIALLAQGVYAMDINQELIKAAECGYIGIFKMIISQPGINVNAQNKNGWTALMVATAYGHQDMAKLLLQYGANINAHTNEGRTALMWTTHFGHHTMVELLLKHGAHVNTQDKDGSTALIWAVDYGHKNIVGLLLNAGADITLKKNNGETALSLVSKRIAQCRGILGLIRRKNYKDYKEIEALLALGSARLKLRTLWKQAAKGYAAQYPGVPVQEILKYLT